MRSHGYCPREGPWRKQAPWKGTSGRFYSGCSLNISETFPWGDVSIVKKCIISSCA